MFLKVTADTAFGIRFLILKPLNVVAQKNLTASISLSDEKVANISCNILQLYITTSGTLDLDIGRRKSDDGSAGDGTSNNGVRN